MSSQSVFFVVPSPVSGFRYVSAAQRGLGALAIRDGPDVSLINGLRPTPKRNDVRSVEARLGGVKVFGFLQQECGGV